MAYDEGLAERVRDILIDTPNLDEKKMFGGLCGERVGWKRKNTSGRWVLLVEIKA